MKVLIWGTGQREKTFYGNGLYRKCYEVVAYIDNDQDKWYSIYRGKKIYPPKDICGLEYDKIIICIKEYKPVYEQLAGEIQIDKANIMTLEQLKGVTEDVFCKKIIDKYKFSEDVEIEKIISYYRNHGFNIFGDYDKRDIDYEVLYDEEEYPYVLLENKRLYYPKDCGFVIKNGKTYVENILGEQQKGSPHLYLRENEQIKEGAVVVDAGVCEGNFALRYIDRVKKLYLIEPDAFWMNALKRTFAQYGDKVVYCSKFLGKCDNEKTITLDTLVSEKVDFLKMDIEGAEIDALLGGRNLLERSNARCSICSYHRQNDEKYIRYLLGNYGYETSTSLGYMFFIYDENIVDSMDFRRGIVYGEKKNG